MGGGSDVTVRWLHPVARRRETPTVPQGGEFRLTADNVPLRGSLPRQAAGFWLADQLPILTNNAAYKADFLRTYGRAGASRRQTTGGDAVPGV